MVHYSSINRSALGCPLAFVAPGLYVATRSPANDCISENYWSSLCPGVDEAAILSAKRVARVPHFLMLVTGCILLLVVMAIIVIVVIVIIIIIMMMIIIIRTITRMQQ